MCGSGDQAVRCWGWMLLLLLHCSREDPKAASDKLTIVFHYWMNMVMMSPEEL